MASRGAAAAIAAGTASSMGSAGSEDIVVSDDPN
jgi:C4-dicarboxylate transporter